MRETMPDQPTEAQTQDGAQTPEQSQDAAAQPRPDAHLRRDEQLLQARETAPRNNLEPDPAQPADAANAEAQDAPGELPDEANQAPDSARPIAAQEGAPHAAEAAQEGAPHAAEAAQAQDTSLPQGETPTSELAWDTAPAEDTAPPEEPLPTPTPTPDLEAEGLAGPAPHAATDAAQDSPPAPGSMGEPAPGFMDAPAPAKCFNFLSWITPLMPLLLAALLFAPLAYDNKSTGIAPQPYASPRLAAAIAQADQGAGLSFWFIPHISGQVAPDVPPMQLWWGAASNALSNHLANLAGPWLGNWFGPFLLVWLFLAAATCLGWIGSRQGRHTGLAACIAAFCGLPFLGMAWLAPELILPPAFSLLGAACLLKGLKKPTFSLAMFAGCVLMALAALAGGIIPAALPLVAAIIAIVGTLNFRRLGEWDLVFGLGLTVLLLGGWLTGSLLFAGSAPLRAYLAGAPLLAGSGCPLPALPLGCFTLLLAATLLPWLALPLLMPTRSGKALLAGVKDWRNRQPFTEALFLGGLLLAGLAALVIHLPAPSALLLMPAGALAALAARSLISLSPAQNNRWGTFCALYLLALGAVFFWMLLDSGREALNAQLGIGANISFGLATWLAPGTVALLAALGMWFFGRGKSSQAGLLRFLLAMLLIAQALAWFSLPVIVPYLKAAPPDMPVLDIVSPLPDGAPDGLPDGPRLHMPLPPESPGITPTVPAAHNATQAPLTQPDILGAPIPALHNATSQAPLPATTLPAQANATLAPAPVNATALPAPLPVNATAPVPDAGGALYGDDLPPQTTPTTPVTPYQPGMHLQEPPLPILDTPIPAPQQPQQP